MTYPRGASETCRVNSQPPQAATQYALSAPTRTTRAASCVAHPLIGMTFGGRSCSRISRFTSFALGHAISHSVVHRPGNRTHDNGQAGKVIGDHGTDYPQHELSTLTALQSRKAGLADPSFCPFSIVGGAPSQGVRNLIWLAGGFAFAAHRPLQPSMARKCSSARKVQIHNVAHPSVSKPEQPCLARPGVFQ